MVRAMLDWQQRKITDRGGHIESHLQVTYTNKATSRLAPDLYRLMS
jgi:hypothetical protein